MRFFLGIFGILGATALWACTETPSFPPCLDPYDNYTNDCPAADAGDGATADADDEGVTEDGASEALDLSEAGSADASGTGAVPEGAALH